jgi:hypothetical protein
MAIVSSHYRSLSAVLHLPTAFRTDTDISQKKPAHGRERELQAWLPDSDTPHLPADDDTFGNATGNTGWDQFAVNEKLFGVTGSFNEDEYTTKLDRNAADFREREIEAQRIAAEILGVCIVYSYICPKSTLPLTICDHPILYRHQQTTPMSGRNAVSMTAARMKKTSESPLDYFPLITSCYNLFRFGAVVRGQNAYIPPGARRGVAGALSPPLNSPIVSGAAVKPEVPKVSVNGPDGAAVGQTQTPSDNTTPAPGTTAAPKVCPFRHRSECIS